MDIKVGKYAGFCRGVQRAVEMVLETSAANNDIPIYTFGPLIHNPQVMDRLTDKGISVLSDIPENGSGIVVIRAHGVQPDVKTRLQQAGFDIVDATCPRVAKIQDLIRTYSAEGYASIIIGDRTHPEIQGFLGFASGNGHVIGTLEELDQLAEFEKAIVVAQSTQNTSFYEQVKQWMAARHPEYKIFDTICDSTGQRQAEVQLLSEEVNLILVVGGWNSGNTKRLYEVARRTGKPAFHIETEKDLHLLNRDLLSPGCTIGITAGASTPMWVIRNVCNELQSLGRPGTDETAPTNNFELTKTQEQEQEMLQGVSRSFALTIPQLPEGLRQRVTTAYLLCRIADTIEDEETLPAEAKRSFFNEFNSLLLDHNMRPVRGFVDHLLPFLSDGTLPAEKELVRQTELVFTSFFSFSERQREILARCLRIMSDGMLRFQETKNPAGLPALSDMIEYCYHVAGVVGEMLTELFCDHSEEIAAQRNGMLSLAPSFGQGLQMTNILKDVWEDQERGACWFPRDIFEGAGFDLQYLNKSTYSPQFGQGLARLVAIAHGCLKNALNYTLLIPRREVGIRKFCLWGIGMAVLTLQNIYNLPQYSSADHIKISRRSVKAVILLTTIWVRNDFMLKNVFRIAARGLPLVYETSVPPCSLWATAGGSNLLYRL